MKPSFSTVFSKVACLAATFLAFSANAQTTPPPALPGVVADASQYLIRGCEVVINLATGWDQLYVNGNLYGNYQHAPQIGQLSQTLYAFLQLYDPTTPEGAPANFKIASVESTLSLYNGDAKVFESQPVTLRRFNSKQENTMDLRFQTALSHVKPGRYVCQVTVIDELGRKFAFPRVSIVVVNGRPG